MVVTPPVVIRPIEPILPKLLRFKFVNHKAPSDPAAMLTGS